MDPDPRSPCSFRFLRRRETSGRPEMDSWYLGSSTLRQLAVAGFIGEVQSRFAHMAKVARKQQVVKDLEAELLRKMLETKQDSFEEA